VPRLLAAALVLLIACGGSGESASPAELVSTDGAGITALLADSEKPVVLNVWASWCGPCRSEAPLLRAAFERHQGAIRFVGVAIQDRPTDSLRFLAEYGIGFENYSDPNRAVPATLGGFGVPITYFFAPGGELVATHSGIIDEQTLALNIDELLTR
jgi:cytochrome c biogenesis protein CcmG/thiol:disulfide interchange protein DsbE